MPQVLAGIAAGWIREALQGMQACSALQEGPLARWPPTCHSSAYSAAMGTAILGPARETSCLCNQHRLQGQLCVLPEDKERKPCRHCCSHTVVTCTLSGMGGS